MNIGLAIYRLRKKAGFTQSKLNMISGVLQTSLSHIESGTKKPNKATIKKLCAALEVPIELLNILAIPIDHLDEKPKSIIQGIQEEILNKYPFN
jgi:transcriptional regulator with XRE-family HTH domain